MMSDLRSRWLCMRPHGLKLHCEHFLCWPHWWPLFWGMPSRRNLTLSVIHKGCIEIDKICLFEVYWRITRRWLVHWWSLFETILRQSLFDQLWSGRQVSMRKLSGSIKPTRSSNTREAWPTLLSLPTSKHVSVFHENKLFYSKHIQCESKSAWWHEIGQIKPGKPLPSLLFLFVICVGPRGSQKFDSYLISWWASVLWLSYIFLKTLPTPSPLSHQGDGVRNLFHDGGRSGNIEYWCFIPSLFFPENIFTCQGSRHTCGTRGGSGLKVKDHNPWLSIKIGGQGFWSLNHG